MKLAASKVDFFGGGEVGDAVVLLGIVPFLVGATVGDLVVATVVVVLGWMVLFVTFAGEVTGGATVDAVQLTLLQLTVSFTKVEFRQTGF